MHHFTGTGGDETLPYAGLIIGRDQNLYGTTSQSGACIQLMSNNLTGIPGNVSGAR